MIGNVLKIVYVHFGAPRIQCGEIKVDSTPLPLAIHKYPSLSRVNDAFILAEIVQKFPLKYNI